MTGKINLIRVVFSIIKTLIIRHTQNLSGPDFLNFIIFSFNFSSTETLRIKTLFFGEKYIKRCLYIYIYVYLSAVGMGPYFDLKLAVKILAIHEINYFSK